MLHYFLENEVRKKIITKYYIIFLLVFSFELRSPENSSLSTLHFDKFIVFRLFNVFYIIIIIYGYSYYNSLL